jgi:drug/metabolite transporter (DMT)-like permease
MADLSLSTRITSGSSPVWGVAAALAAVTLWALWIVGTRHAVSRLDPAAIALLRYGVPALVFAGVTMRIGLLPRGVPWRLLALMLGSGAPYFLVVATGMRYAPAADAGPLLPGTMPLIVALISAFWFRERLGGVRILGLVLIAAGIVAIGGLGLADTASGAWRGHLLFVLGALLWALYTIAFKRSGLDATAAVAVVSLWSTVMVLPWGAPALLQAMSDGLWRDLVLQTLLQGVLSGVVAHVLYGHAIASLGATRGAAFVALMPALTAVFAIPLLGEVPTAAAVVGIVATGLGVLLTTVRPQKA